MIYLTKGGDLMYKKEVLEALERLEEDCFGSAVVDRIIEWVLGLYDFDTCGFYYKTSAKQTMGFLPELEMTAKALSVLKNLGILEPSRLLELYTPEMKERFLYFVKRYQSPEDGFWYEMPWGKNIYDSKRLYESNAAKQLLRMIGEKPLYPTAEERVHDHIPEMNDTRLLSEKERLAAKKFHSREDFKAWFDVYLPWDTSVYSAGSYLFSHKSLIDSAGYTDYMMMLLFDRLNPETGYLDHTTASSARDYDHMSGTYKISNYYLQSDRYEMPYFDKVLESTAHTIVTDYPGTNGCHIANPWALFKNAIGSQKNPDPNVMARYYEQLPSLLAHTRAKILSLRAPDGIYAFTPGVGACANQGMPAALPLWEGDLNGVAMVIAATRNHIYDALGLKAPPLVGTISPKEVIERLLATPRTKKIVPVGNCRYDFSKMPTGPLPFGEGFRYSGDVAVGSDPDAPTENVLCIHANGTCARPILVIDAGTKSGRGFTCQYSIKWKSDAECARFLFVRFGTCSYSVVLRHDKIQNGCTLSRIADESKVVFTGEDWTETYHTVKVEYTPNGKDTAAKIWIDGVLVDEVSSFTGGPGENPVPENAYAVTFFTDHDGVYTAYLRDFTFAEME